MKPLSRLIASVKDLEVQYDEGFALRCDDLRLEGNVFAILGHNGAGKSTFIKSTLGLLQPRRGTLRFEHHDGESITELRPERHMAFCPENGAVFADISVESYLKLWCRIKHRDGAFYRKGGSHFIEKLQIGPLMSKLGRELSKGQRRRVQTAIGFLIQPKLFLFDEPFDGLDVQRSSELAELMACEAAGMSIFLSSHRMDVVERLADSVLVLREGRIIAAGPTVEVAKKLGGTTRRLSGMVDIELALTYVRSALPDCVVNRSGSELSVTGEGDIEGQLYKLGLMEGVRATQQHPTLTDAMSYHLRQVRSVVTSD